MTVCKGCGAEVIFVKLDTGKSLPVDATPTADGSVVAGVFLGQWTARVTRRGDTLVIPAGFNRYTPHWATCPQAASFRKPKRRNES